MAFATEHPVLAHSEYRPVDQVVRAGGRFEVVSEYQPAGDQPAAIDELGVPYGLRATESCRTYKLRATPSTSASSVSEVRAAARAELEPVSDM